ncbi:RNA polymerase I subunit RpI12 [Oratosquilla oratoria]|uniref:RNA polymerase I subunit RpI12 n=1 Tax=Oratosquilla oratoria TaxID=337810 RepID=UPI003F7750E9
MLRSSKNKFESYPEFCSDCGAILILPDIGVTVTCNVCKNTISLEDDIIGKEVTYSIEFVPLGIHTSGKRGVDKGEAGQMDNDRECSKCGNRGMSYTTMQLRSADEGQTVFYLCPKCKHREVENS